MRYFLYARRSSDEASGKQAQSLEGQVEVCRQIERNEGLIVVDVYQESRTAKKPGRPLFVDMLARIERGEGDAILCYNLDRLSRNPKDSGDLRWMLQQGIIQEIRTPHQTYLPRDSCLMTGIETTMAEQFIIHHTERVERGMRQKIRSGGFPHRAPEGYLNNRLEKTIEPDPIRFPLLRRAWELLLTGTCTVPEIHRILHNEWGFRKRPTKRTNSDRYPVSLLYALFSNPFYAGVARSWGEEYTGTWIPMVTPEEFQRAQEILGVRACKHPVRRTFAYTGLIQCGRCGCTITAEVSKGNTYYHCTNRLGVCNYHSVRAERLDELFQEKLDGIALGPAFVSWAEDVLARDAEERERAERAQTASRQATRASVRKQLDILLTLRLREQISEDEFTARRRSLDQEEALLNVADRDRGTNAERVAAEVLRTIQFAGNAPAQFREAPDEDKRFYLRQYARSLTLTDGVLEAEVWPALQPVLTARSQGAGAALALELPETGSDSRQNSPDDDVVKVWWCILHAIRTALLESTYGSY